MRPRSAAPWSALVVLPSVIAGVACAAPAAGGSQPAVPSPATAHATSPTPRFGRWTGTATDDAGTHAVSFRVVRRGRGVAIRDLRVRLHERCVDPTGKTPDTNLESVVLVPRIVVHSTGRFALIEGDADTSGRFLTSRRMTGRAEGAPVGLYCTGTRGTFRATAVGR